MLAYEPLENKPADNEWDPNFWRNKVWLMNGDPINPGNIGTPIHYAIDPMIINLLKDNEHGLEPYNVSLTSLGNWEPEFDNLLCMDTKVTIGSTIREARNAYNQLFNQKQWLVNYNDHGFTYGWAYYDTNLPTGSVLPKNNSYIYDPNANPVFNNGFDADGKCRLPFVLSEACETGWFDSKDNNSRNCFAEDLLLKDSNGAIGMVANPRNEAVVFDGNYIMYKALLKKNLQQIGEMLLGSKLNPGFFTTHAFSHNLYGDPALNIFYDRSSYGKPDLVAKITEKDLLKLRYKSSFPVANYKICLSNIGNVSNSYTTNLIVSLDNRDNVIYSQQVTIRDLISLDLNCNVTYSGLHRIFIKLQPLSNSAELLETNNFDSADVFIGKYQTDYPKKNDADILQVADYDMDGKDDFITNLGVYNQNIRIKTIIHLPLGSWYSLVSKITE